jgi:hypothetical protein
MKATMYLSLAKVVTKTADAASKVSLYGLERHGGFFDQLTVKDAKQREAPADSSVLCR